MNKKEILAKLEKYPSMKNRISQLEAKVREYEAKKIELRSVKSMNLTGMPKGNSVSDPVSASASKIIDVYDKQIEDIIPELVNLQTDCNRLEFVIAQLNEKEKAVMEMYYFNELPWKTIAFELRCSESSVFKLRKTALLKLPELWNQFNS